MEEFQTREGLLLFDREIQQGIVPNPNGTQIHFHLENRTIVIDEGVSPDLHRDQIRVRLLLKAARLLL